MARFEYSHDMPESEGFYQYKKYINSPARYCRVEYRNGQMQALFLGHYDYENCKDFTGQWYGPMAPLNELHVIVRG